MRLTYGLDHSSQSWDLFIDGQLRLFDLGFLDNSASALSQLSLRSDGQRTSLLDYVYAGATNPLFTDTSGDGLPDDWLNAHGLNPSLYQRYADTGELTGIDYEDPNTSDITYTYDRLGRQVTVTDATGTRSFNYDTATLQLDAEDLDATFYDGLELTHSYDTLGRASGYTLSGAGTSLSSSYCYRSN